MARVPPQMYRGPPRVYFPGNENEEDEENRSEPLTDTDESLLEAPIAPDDFRVPQNRRANSARHRNSQSRRPRRWEPDDSSSSIHSAYPRPYARGETVRYGELYESYPHPPPMRHSPPPTKPHRTNRQSANRHSASRYPENRYPDVDIVMDHEAYPAIRHRANLQDLHANPSNPYHANPYPVPLYSTNHPFMSSYGPTPHVPPQLTTNAPYSVENEVEKIKRELSSFKMEQMAKLEREKEKLQADEYKRKQDQEAEERREANRRNLEILKRQMERQVKAEIGKQLPPKRSLRHKETGSDTGRSAMVREAMEHMENERRREEGFPLPEERRYGEAERLLLQLVELAEQRRTGYGWRTWNEGPTRSKLEEPSRSRLEGTGSRRELTPREFDQNEDDDRLRKLELLVLDVLQRLDEKETQEKNRRPLPASQSVDHGMEYNRASESQQRRRGRQAHSHGAKQAEYTTHNEGTGLQSSASDTNISHGDQYSHSESYESTNHSQYSPPPSHRRDRKHNLQTTYPPQSRQPLNDGQVHDSTPDLDNTQEQFIRNASDDGPPFATNTKTDRSRNSSSGAAQFDKGRGKTSMGRGSTARRSTTEAKRRRHYDATTQVVDESEHLSSSEEESDEEVYPTRSTKYAYVARGASRRSRQKVDKTIPPEAPEAPNPPLKKNR